MNTGEIAAYFEARAESFNVGVEASAALIQAKANELYAIGNPTATMMARIFEEQVEAIKALRRQ